MDYNLLEKKNARLEYWHKSASEQQAESTK